MVVASFLQPPDYQSKLLASVCATTGLPNRNGPPPFVQPQKDYQMAHLLCATTGRRWQHLLCATTGLPISNCSPPFVQPPDYQMARLLCATTRRQWLSPPFCNHRTTNRNCSPPFVQPPDYLIEMDRLLLCNHKRTTKWPASFVQPPDDDGNTSFVQPPDYPFRIARLRLYNRRTTKWPASFDQATH